MKREIVIISAFLFNLGISHAQEKGPDAVGNHPGYKPVLSSMGREELQDAIDQMEDRVRELSHHGSYCQDCDAPDVDKTLKIARAVFPKDFLGKDDSAARQFLVGKWNRLVPTLMGPRVEFDFSKFAQTPEYMAFAKAHPDEVTDDKIYSDRTLKVRSENNQELADLSAKLTDYKSRLDKIDRLEKTHTQQCGPDAAGALTGVTATTIKKMKSDLKNGSTRYTVVANIESSATSVYDFSTKAFRTNPVPLGLRTNVDILDQKTAVEAACKLSKKYGNNVWVVRADTSSNHTFCEGSGCCQ